MHYNITVLSGDGVGTEVVAEGVRVLRLAAEQSGFSVEFEEGLVGGASIDAYGTPLTDSVLRLAGQGDAVLLGAVGGPKWDRLEYSIRPERALLRLRQELGLFANLRPVRSMDALLDASSLKRSVIEGVDLIVVRELTGDVYFGTPKGIFPGKDGERAVNTMVYTTRAGSQKDRGVCFSSGPPAKEKGHVRRQGKHSGVEPALEKSRGGSA
jgi:3-isopropylmalate dehydrogenase